MAGDSGVCRCWAYSGLKTKGNASYCNAFHGCNAPLCQLRLRHLDLRHIAMAPSRPIPSQICRAFHWGAVTLRFV
eukprot:4027320-Amphidinium_carterae.1